MAEKKEEKKEVKKNDFVERKLKVINTMEDEAKARFLANRVLDNK